MGRGGREGYVTQRGIILPTRYVGHAGAAAEDEAHGFRVRPMAFW